MLFINIYIYYIYVYKYMYIYIYYIYVYIYISHFLVAQNLAPAVSFEIPSSFRRKSQLRPHSLRSVSWALRLEEGYYDFEVNA